MYHLVWRLCVWLTWQMRKLPGSWYVSGDAADWMKWAWPGRTLIVEGIDECYVLYARWFEVKFSYIGHDDVPYQDIILKLKAEEGGYDLQLFGLKYHKDSPVYEAIEKQFNK